MNREGIVVIFVWGVVLGLSFWEGYAAAPGAPVKPLVRQYYKKLNTCDNAEAFVQHQVKLMWSKDHNLTAKLLKLLYADCMVNGCDASILLNGPNTERTAKQNVWLRGYPVIDKIKTVLESRCPGVVSCADILVLATRDAVALAGGPSYPVLLGRKDAKESKASWINYPSPSSTWQQGLAFFQSRGLNVQDFVNLMGMHSVGKTHCSNILDRLYNFKNTGKPDPTMSQSLLNDLRKQCPQKTRKGQHDPLVFLTPEGRQLNYELTNTTYFSRIQKHEAVLAIDQQLLYGPDTSQLVEEYANSYKDYKFGIALSMNKMSNVNVLIGAQGEVRKVCSRPN